MAATGYTPISLYYSSTATNAPTAGNLVNGELALNITDGKLYYKDNTGTVQVIAGKGGAGVAGGSNTQVQYNSSGSLAGSANMTFNGTSLTLTNDATIHGLTVGLGGGSLASNTVVGNGAFAVNTTGQANAAFGGQYSGIVVGALSSNTTGSANSALGIAALGYNTTGSNNTAQGFAALYNNTTASNNTAVGYESSYTNTTGAYNTSVGMLSLYANTTGQINTAIGYAALTSNTTGSYNTALGVNALNNNTTASANTAIGYQAGYSNTTGTPNLFFGYQSGYTNTAGSYNIFIGNSAGYTSNASGVAGNVCLGVSAGYSLTTGIANTFIGTGNPASLYPSGYYVTTGSYNTILGPFNGNSGGLDIRTASNYIVLSDGAGNPRGIFDGSGNFLVGATTNLAKLTVINGNVVQYTAAWRNDNSGTNYFHSFNYNGSEIGSIKGNNTVTSYNVTSDRRLKENIAPFTSGLETISALKPSQYNYISDKNIVYQGFIADELQQVVPHAVTGEANAVDADGKPVYQGVDASFLVPHLVAAIQELTAKLKSAGVAGF